MNEFRPGDRVIILNSYKHDDFHGCIGTVSNVYDDDWYANVRVINSGELMAVDFEHLFNLGQESTPDMEAFLKEAPEIVALLKDFISAIKGAGEAFYEVVKSVADQAEKEEIGIGKEFEKRYGETSRHVDEIRRKMGLDP